MLCGNIPRAYTSAVATFGENVARIRKEKGLSQVDLADRLKVRQPSAWKIEQAKNPEVLTLLKVANALECSVEELVAGVDEEYSKRRDLPGHTSEGTSNPHSGRADVPASAQARVRELEQDRAAVLDHVQVIANELLDFVTGARERAGGKGAAPPDRAASGGRRGRGTRR